MPSIYYSFLEHLQDSADAYGLISGAVLAIAAFVGWLMQRNEKRNHEKERAEDQVMFRNCINDLTLSIYKDTRAAIVQIFGEIANAIATKVRELHDILEAIEAKLEEVLEEIGREKVKQPVFTEKLQRLEREYESLKGASNEAKSQIAMLEADRLAASSVASDLLDGRWEPVVVEAQLGRLGHILESVNGGHAIRAAAVSAKSARLTEGKKYLENLQKINQIGEREEEMVVWSVAAGSGSGERAILASHVADDHGLKEGTQKQ